MSWYYLKTDLENSRSSQGQEGASLEACCSGGEPCAPLRSKTIHAEFYCNGKLMDSYLDSLSGTMREPLAGNPGEEKSMSLAGDSPVKISVAPGKAKESREKNQDCGKNLPVSLARYNQDSRSWKTHQCLLLGGLEPFSGIFPKWGTMLDGELWGRTMPGHLISAIGYGLLLPTPVSTDATAGASGSIGLARHVKLYPTPKAQLSRASGERHGNGGQSLDVVVGGRLNPPWVEWLMGWPIGWTDLKLLGMDKFQLVRPWHGQYYLAKTMIDWFATHGIVLETTKEGGFQDEPERKEQDMV